MTTIIVRDTQIIAAEINSIKEQVIRTALSGSIEIGKKLKEAKEVVPHGEWENWLSEYVDYSKSTANNLMRVYEQSSNLQALGDISFTQAISLLGLPPEDREAFVKDNDLAEMTTRELQQAIKDKQNLEKQLKDAQDAAEVERLTNEEALEAAEADSQLLINQHNELVLKLNTDLEAALKTPSENGTAKKLKADLDKAKADLAASQKKAKELEEKLKKAPATDPAAKAVIPEETQKELETLRKAQEDHAAQLKQKELEAEKQVAAMQEQLDKNNNTASIKVKVSLAALVDNFKALLAAVNEVSNPEEKDKFKADIVTLCDRLKGTAV
ncbi:MAG: hypothetical protein JWM44_4187 [Bacilli bacterium]|nr:hypothetical protein [Bacilli bacterium]